MEKQKSIILPKLPSPIIGPIKPSTTSLSAHQITHRTAHANWMTNRNRQWVQLTRFTHPQHRPQASTCVCVSLGRCPLVIQLLIILGIGDGYQFHKPTAVATLSRSWLPFHSHHYPPTRALATRLLRLYVCLPLFPGLLSTYYLQMRDMTFFPPSPLSQSHPHQPNAGGGRLIVPSPPSYFMQLGRIGRPGKISGYNMGTNEEWSNR